MPSRTQPTATRNSPMCIRTSGNPDKARAALRHYAEAAQAAGDIDSYIDALLGLAEVETEADEYEQAVSQAFLAFTQGIHHKSPHSRRALELLARQSDRIGAARVRQILADKVGTDAAKLLDNALTRLDQPDG